VKFALGLLVGWVVGSRLLDSDYRDVTDALRAIGRSEELRDLVQTVRAHGGRTLRDVADLLEAGPAEPPPVADSDDDLVARVTDLRDRRAR
jgi:hypothetical protein